MSLRRIIVRYLACFATLVVVASPAVYAQAPARASRAPQVTHSRPQMSVIEVTSQTSGANHFTVVGAVHRSGVFTSQKQKIQLKDLIEAAGGLTDSARSSIRVIRGGQDRYRLLNNPENPAQQNVHAGDVIVVLPKAGVQSIHENNPVVPVACIGLARRPVVLPLSPDIRTVDDLIAKLRQPFQLRSTIRIMDPFGRTGTVKLAPGSVLFFDAATVDRTPFSSPETFPPTAPLTKNLPEDHQENAEFNSPKITPGIIPTPLHPGRLTPEIRPSATERVYSQPPLSAVAEQSSLSVGSPPIPEPPQVSSRDLFLANSISPSASQSESVPLEIKPTHQSEIDLPLLKNQPGDYGSANDLLASQKLPTTAPAPPELAAAELDSEVASTDLSSATMRAATKNPMSRSSDLKKSERVAPQFSDITQQLSGSPEPQKNSKLATKSILPIALGVAFLGAICLIGSILWSRYDRHIVEHQGRFAATEATEEVVADFDSTQNQVAFVLNRSAPMIEEEVILPTDTPIHGEPVGHRRIIVHERHERISGPHFGRKNRTTQDSQAASASSRIDSEESETKVKQRIDSPNEEFSETNLKRTQKTMVQPVQETVSSLYDVVKPVSKVTSSKSIGALDRALMALAAEKKQ